MRNSRIINVLFGLSVLLSASFASAGINTWTAGGPEGGFTSAVAPNPLQPSVVMASTNGGIYRSIDGGTSWTRATAPAGSNPRNFTFDPTEVNRVIGANGYLLDSEDNGQTFVQLPSARQPPELGVSEVRFNRDGSYLFALLYSGKVFRSSTLGASWTEVTGTWPLNPPSAAIFAVDPNAANTLYVAITGSGVFKSINAGANWTATGAGPAATTTYFANQIAIQPGDSTRAAVAMNDGVYVSANGGDVWSHPYPYGSGSIAFDPAAPQNLLAIGYDGSIVKNTDSGANFPLSSNGADLRRYYQLRGLQFVPSVPNKLFVACGDGPLVSTDAGLSFAPSVSGIRAESLASLSASDDGTAYAAFVSGPAGIFKRSNTGWQPVNNVALFTAGVFSLGFSNPLMAKVAVAPQNANLVYAVFYNDSIAKSTDGGTSWVYAGSPLLNGGRQLRQFAIDPSNANVAYTGSVTDGVWKTTDGGQNWTKQSSGLPAGTISALAIDRANPQIVYAGISLLTAPSIYKTINGGASWAPAGVLQPAAIPLNFTISPDDSKIVYAATGAGIYKSIDSGATWGSSIGTGVARNLGVDAVLPSTLLGGLSSFPGGFARSVDAGATWDSFPVPDALAHQNTLDVIAVDPARTSHVMMGGFGTGILEYEVAPDLDARISVPGATVLLNSQFNATATVRNLGPGPASASELRVTLPAWLTPAPPAGCAFTAPTLICAVSTLTVGAGPRDVVIPLTVAASPGTGSIGVQLNAHELDPVLTNNTASAALASIAQSDLSVALSGGSRAVVVNDAVSFTATVTNGGPTLAPNTRVRLQVPASVTIQTVVPSTGTCATAGATTTCTLNTLANAASATITFTGTANAAGSAAFTVDVLADTQDGVATNNTAATTFTISSPPAPAPGGGGKHGGGRFDWLAVLLLGALAASQARLRLRAASRRLAAAG